MRTIVYAVVLGAALAWPVAYAQQDQGNDDEHAGHHPSEAAASPSDKPESLQQQMKKMQALMAEIQATTDPDQRKALLAQHLQAMRDQIKAIRKVAGMKMGMMAATERGKTATDTGKGEDMMAKCEMMKGGGMRTGGMMMMHKRVEQRLDMLEMMLEQLIEHEAGEASIENR